MYRDSGPESLANLDRPTSLAMDHDWYFPYVPVPDSEVSNYITDIQKPSEHQLGKVYTDGVTMTDDHTYAVVRGVPDEPICDFSLVMTTAWLTSPRGHNRHTVEHFMRLGIPIVAVGAEGSFRDGQKLVGGSIMGRLANISVGNTAHNLHEILGTVDQLVDNESVGTNQVVVLGESRGGMVAEAFIAIAGHHGRSVIYSDITAPCFPEGFDLRDLPDMAKQAVKEPLELVRSIGSFTLGRLIHYPETLDLHPSALLHSVATIPALLNTDTGNFARRIPKDHNQHITVFRDDVICNVRGWQKILKHHPNIRIMPIDGAHVTIAHPTTLRHIDSRILSLIHEIGRSSSIDPADIDFSNVHLNDGRKPL